ncbi:MAG: UpxY family transcription antiterminator [Bacteroidetes Order II. Incertae sedis bacterium]|nr:UpxY family transcription antiterminator [Bacteroidetes Order II. bacterium]
MAKGVAAVDKEIPKWFAVRTRFKWEKKVVENLQNAAIEVYLPLYEKVKRYEKVIKRTTLPLIPNYLFVKIIKDEYVTVFKQEGVMGFLHNHGSLNAIPEQEIEILRRFNGEWEDLEVVEGKWDKGTPVKIVSGPLAGYEGKVVEEQGKNKVVIFMQSLNHSIIISINKKHICN